MSAIQNAQNSLELWNGEKYSDAYVGMRLANAVGNLLWMEQFSVTTVFVQPITGKRIVHVWGPYESRKEATNVVAKMKRDDRRRWKEEGGTDWIASGNLTIHIGQISTPTGITLTDTAEGNPKTHKRCLRTRLDGKQCDLVRDHNSTHEVLVEGQKHPHAFAKANRS